MFWFFISCSDNTLVYEKVVEAENSEPNIAVYPREIDFGSIDAGEEREEKIYIVNTGYGDLEIEMMEVFATPSIVINSDSSFIISPNEEKEVEISYYPTTRQLDLGYLGIHSNDPDTPLEEVLILGSGNAPVISVTPEEYDYGVVEISCERQIEIEITNNGNKTLEITNIILLSSSTDELDLDLNLIHNGNFNWYLNPEESLLIDNIYIPNDVVSDSAIIRIESNDPLNSYKNVDIYGESFISAYYEESFQQQYTSQADIVFVIDNSGSMNNFQNLVSDNFNDFLSVFFHQGIDYRIGIITTDDSDFYFNYIDQNTQNPNNYFSNWIGAIGTGGSATEKGLEMLYDSYTYGDLSSNFIRNNANFVVIFISDEGDHSQNNYSFYYNSLISLKPDQNLIQVHSVIGGPPHGCSATVNGVSLNADFGSGYYELTNLFGGNIYNICSSHWGAQMQNLALSSLPMSQFQLSQEAAEGSITVYVDGIEALGWTFDPVSNSVIFGNGFIPPLGSAVDIHYGLKTECQEQ